MSGTIPYGATERDLGRLAHERVAAAIASVIRLTTTPEQAFAVSVMAHAAAAGNMAADYAILHGVSPPDWTELAIAILTAQRDARLAREAEAS